MKTGILVGITTATLVVVIFAQPLPQDLQYHQFADQKTFAGIHHAWNVLSNIGFILVGLFGLARTKSAIPDRERGSLRTIYVTFFIGMLLTGFGSGYYHSAPSNETLIWDRLPMTISFMSFFSFILYIHINERIGGSLLWPLLATGIVSVLYWAYTEQAGKGDLRFYAVVQFLPLLLIPMIVLMFPSDSYKQSYIWLILLIYLAAKALEHFDYEIYGFSGISGHSCKHLIAAFSGIAFHQAIASIHRQTPTPV